MKRLTEARLVLYCFGPRIDEPLPVFAPRRNEPPLKKRGFPYTVMLKNCQDILTGRDVVAGKQRWKVRMINAVELHPSG